MPILLPQKPVLHRAPITHRRTTWIAPVRHVRPAPAPVRASVEVPEWFSVGIVYFTSFYCTMNWLYYRGLREDFEAFKKEQEEKKTKK